MNVISSTLRALLGILPVTFCLAGVYVLAQNPSRPSQETTTTPTELRPPSIRERQMIMRQMELEAGRPRTPEEEKLALEQIAEDYSRIQAINNKMMADTFSKKNPNYTHIAESLAEIRKRAVRLTPALLLKKSFAVVTVFRWYS